MISKLSAKYQFCVIHTADNTDGKVTIVRRLSTVSDKVHRLDPPLFHATSKRHKQLSWHALPSDPKL